MNNLPFVGGLIGTITILRSLDRKKERISKGGGQKTVEMYKIEGKKYPKMYMWCKLLAKI